MLAQIVLFDGFDPLDAIAPYEVLTAGGLVADGVLEAELVSVEGPRDVPSRLGPLCLRASARLAPSRADVIILPGAAGRLAEGLVDGRPATTHRLGLNLLHATGVTPIDARIVDDGDLVTAASVTSGLDLALYLLEREVGPRVAVAVEKLFAHERRGAVWRATGSAPTIRA